MKNFCSFLVTLILFFGIPVSANESITFVDMDYVINQSNAGKQITEELSKKHKSNLKKFSKMEQSLKDEEKKIISQKNILEKAEFEKKIVLLREKANNYRKERREVIDNLTKQKIYTTTKFLDLVKPILAKYSSDQSISIIIEKKNIIIGKSELDITKDILKLVNSNVAKINIE